MKTVINSPEKNAEVS